MLPSKASCILTILILALCLSSVLQLFQGAYGTILIIKICNAEGDPLKDAEVYLYNGTGKLIGHDTTDADGKAKIDVGSLKVSNPSLKVYYEGVLVYYLKDSSLEEIAKKHEVSVYPVVFNVTDYKGRPLSAKLSITGRNGFHFSGTANKSGSLKVNIPLSVEEGQDNTFDIKVGWQGVDVYTESRLFIRGNVPSVLTLKCHVFPLTIRIYDMAYKPLPAQWSLGDVFLKGIEVQITHPNGTSLTFNSPTIDLSGMPKGKYAIKVSWWGLITLYEDTFWLTSDTYTEPIKVMCKVYDVVLRLTDTLGYPLNDTDFKLVLPHVNKEIDIRTDENGEVRISSIIDGTYTIYSEWRGIRSAYSFEISGPKTYTVSLPIYNVMLKAYALGANSVPLRNALIRLYVLKGGTTTLLLEDRCDSRGKITLYKLPKALYKAEVYWQGILVGEKYFRPEELGSFAKIELPCEVYLFRPRITDLKKAPLAGAKVVMYMANGSYLHLKTSSSGFLDLGPLPVGVYSLNVSWRNVKVGSFKVSLPHQGNPRGDFEDNLVCNVHDLVVAVKGALGQPLDGAYVELWLSANKIGEVKTKSGGVRFEQLPIGTYIIRVRYLDASTTDSVTLSNNDPPTLNKECRLDVFFTIDGKAFPLWLGLVLIGLIIVGASFAMSFIRRMLRERTYKGLIAPPEEFEEERKSRRFRLRRR